MRSIQDNFRGQWSTVPAGPVYWMPGFSYVLNIILSLVCLWTVAWSEGLVWFPCYSLMSVCADFVYYAFVWVMDTWLFSWVWSVLYSASTSTYGCKFCHYFLENFEDVDICWNITLHRDFFLEYQEFCGGRMLWIYSTGFLGLVLSCGVRYWLLFHNRTIVHYDTYRLYVRPYWNILTPCRSYNTVHNLHPPRHNTW